MPLLPMSEPKNHDPLPESCVPDASPVPPPMDTTQTYPKLAVEFCENCVEIPIYPAQEQEFVNDTQSRISGESNEAVLDPLPDSSVPDAIPVPLPLDTTQTDPKLTSQLRADCEALRNDLEQAQELANDFQSQLSGKSNEAAHFKHLLEKTQSHLEKLQADITRLRQERHGLANDVMRLQAIEMQKTELTTERNRFAAELACLRRGLAEGEKEKKCRNKERERQETILKLQVQVLRKQLQALRSSPGIRERMAACDPTVRGELESLGEIVNDLLAVLDSEVASDTAGLDPICSTPRILRHFPDAKVEVIPLGQ